jgi:type I restriction enzyme S subunit
MNWEMKTLGEIGEWGSGGTPFSSQSEYYNGTIPWLIIEDLNDSIVTTSQKTITELGLRNSSAKIVEPGTLLIAMYGSIGKLGIAGIPCATNQAIAFCRCNSALIDVNFLFYYLLFSREKLLELGRGNTQQNIGQAVLKEYPIPLLPLPEQRRISALLRRADHLRRMQRNADGLSATVLQAMFLELFGDLASNPKGWDHSTIEELSTQVTDGEHVTPKRTDAGIKLLSARNIQNGYIDFATGLDYISQEEYERIKVRLNPEYGDVLMSCSGTVGRVTTVDIKEPFSMVRSVALIKQKRSIINSKYLEHYLRSNYGQRIIFQSANISGQPNIFQRQIRELPVLLPPLPEQERFAGVVRRVEALRRRQAEARRQAEGLFQTLLAQSFESV